jgi:hypothetical protein
MLAHTLTYLRLRNSLLSAKLMLYGSYLLYAHTPLHLGYRCGGWILCCENYFLAYYYLAH